MRILTWRRIEISTTDKAALTGEPDRAPKLHLAISLNQHGVRSCESTTDMAYLCIQGEEIESIYTALELLHPL